MFKKRLKGLVLLCVHYDLDTVRSLSSLSVLERWDVGTIRRIALAFEKRSQCKQ